MHSPPLNTHDTDRHSNVLWNTITQSHTVTQVRADSEVGNCDNFHFKDFLVHIRLQNTHVCFQSYITPPKMLCLNLDTRNKIMLIKSKCTKKGTFYYFLFLWNHSWFHHSYQTDFHHSWFKKDKTVKKTGQFPLELTDSVSRVGHFTQQFDSPYLDWRQQPIWHWHGRHMGLCKTSQLIFVC